MFFDYNCKPDSENPIAFLGRAVFFYMAPCASHEDDIGTEVTQCEPGEADFWSVYGVQEDGEHFAIHDRPTAELAVQTLAQIAVLTLKPVQYHDERYGGVPASGPTACLTSIAEWLTETIHRDIDALPEPAIDHDTFRDHALADVRAGFVAYSSYGQDRARNPFLTADTQENAA